MTRVGMLSGMVNKQFLPRQNYLAPNASGAVPLESLWGRVAVARALDSPSPGLCRSAVGSSLFAERNVGGGALLT